MNDAGSHGVPSSDLNSTNRAHLLPQLTPLEYQQAFKRSTKVKWDRGTLQRRCHLRPATRSFYCGHFGHDKQINALSTDKDA